MENVLQDLFAVCHTFDIVSSTCQSLHEVVTSGLDAFLHRWDARFVAFHTMGGNAKTELNPTLSSLQSTGSRSHAVPLDVDALFSEVVIWSQLRGCQSCREREEKFELNRRTINEVLLR